MMLYSGAERSRLGIEDQEPDFTTARSEGPSGIGIITILFHINISIVIIIMIIILTTINIIIIIIIVIITIIIMISIIVVIYMYHITCCAYVTLYHIMLYDTNQLIIIYVIIS